MVIAGDRPQFRMEGRLPERCRRLAGALPGPSTVGLWRASGVGFPGGEHPEEQTEGDRRRRNDDDRTEWRVAILAVPGC